MVLALPTSIDLLSDEAARGYFVDGFKVASLMVVFTLMFGAALAYFYKAPRRESDSEVAALKPSLQASSDD